jgi:predicted dehydrogenase
MSTLTAGILGALRGMTHATILDALPDVTVTGLAERAESPLRAGLSRLPNARGYTDYADMLSDPPDIVVVASSPQDHARHCCMALEAGCAVLSEVPAAHTLEDAQTLVDTVKRTGGFYMLGENCNYYGYMLEWQRRIQAGELGTIVHAEGEYIHDIRHMTWTDGEGQWFGPEEAQNRPGTRPHWRNDYHPIQYITHSLGPLLMLLQTRCTHVSCLMAPPRAHPAIASPDIETAHFRTEADAPIRQTCGFAVPREPGGQWYSVYGTKGYVEWKRAGWDSGKLYRDGQEVHDALRMDWPVAPDIGELTGIGGHGGIDAGLVLAFVSVLRAGDPPPIGIHEAMDYTLPGIYAAMSAEAGGELLRIPDSRCEPIAR